MPPKIDPTGSEIDPHRGGAFQLGIIKEAMPPPSN